MRKKFLLLCAVCLLLAGCAGNVGNSGNAGGSENAGNSGNSAAPELPTEASSGDMPAPVPAEPPADEPAYQPYSFGEPLEESEAVDDAYFEDAVFLGDSRTEDLQIWGGIHAGDYYWKWGMSVFLADDQEYTFTVDGEEVTMLGALARKQYGKVYIMLGVNELGYPAWEYEEGLGALLDRIIELQPEAVIYLQTLPPLNDELARQNLADYENNENVDAFNQVIVRMAGEKRVVLLDTAEAYRGEDGQLPADLSYDGCHFTSDGYAIWADYLRSHTMEAERYFRCREAGETGEGASG